MVEDPFAEIRGIMAARKPQSLPGTRENRAAVALLLQPRGGEIEVLFMERTEREGDPWSGHLAFPGGRVEEHDPDVRAAAERETLEEIGLDLRTAEYLGSLDDVTGAALPVVVSGFVYGVQNPGPFELSSEVREAFWISLHELSDPTRHIERHFEFGGVEHVVPAIDLLGPGRPVLWGLTYRLVMQLLCSLKRCTCVLKEYENPRGWEAGHLTLYPVLVSPQPSTLGR